MDAKLQRARRQERLSDQAPRVLLNPLPRISRVRREEAEDRKKKQTKRAEESEVSGGDGTQDCI